MGVAYNSNPELKGKIASSRSWLRRPCAERRGPGAVGPRHRCREGRGGRVPEVLRGERSRADVPGPAARSRQPPRASRPSSSRVRTTRACWRPSRRACPGRELPGAMAAVKTALGNAHSAVFSGEADNAAAVATLKYRDRPDPGREPVTHPTPPVTSGRSGRAAPRRPGRYLTLKEVKTLAQSSSTSARAVRMKGPAPPTGRVGRLQVAGAGPWPRLRPAGRDGVALIIYPMFYGGYISFFNTNLAQQMGLCRPPELHLQALTTSSFYSSVWLTSSS